MTETIKFPTFDVNQSFDTELEFNSGRSEFLPGFGKLDTEHLQDAANNRHGMVDAVFLITRMTDGKLFGAKYSDPVEDFAYAESPFYGDEVEFVEYQVEEYTVVKRRWIPVTEESVQA